VEIQPAKLYVGCALTNASETFKDEVLAFKETLRERGHEVFEFVGLTAGDDEQVYRHDLSCVRKSELFIAICDYPSTGLGWELGDAASRNKKVLMASQQPITRMVTGSAKVEPNFYYTRYNEISDLIPKVDEIVALKRRRNFGRYLSRLSFDLSS
jgi:hypothetical protein